MEGHFAVRAWIPKKTQIDTNNIHDTLTIYDAGNIQGFLVKFSSGKTTWVVYQVDYRLLQEDGTIIEGCEVLPETLAPFQFISIETYPLQLKQLEEFQFLFSLPETQILLSLSEQPLFPPPLPQQQQLPFPPQRQEGGGPGRHGPQRLNVKRPTHVQQSSQNKNTTSPRPMALSSSNLNDHGQHLSPALTKQVIHQQPLPPTHHNAHESAESPPWTSLAQQSLYSRPPPELEVKHAV